MTNQEIKKEGRAGLFFAYDANHNLTAADDAITGVPYTCPYCKCAMHVTTTKSGKHIFARYPRAVHADPSCITIEVKGVERSFVNLDPHKFIASLCHPTPRKQRTDKSTSGVERNTANSDQDTEQESRLASFRSLKDIAESGIEHLNPYDMQGGHKICEFIMTYKYAMTFFLDPYFVLGSRVVTARYMRYDSDTQSLIFCMFQNGYCVRFRLIFLNYGDYQKYKGMFFTKVLINGKTIPQRNYEAQDVLIASDNWEKIEEPDCQSFCPSGSESCPTCLGMYQAVFTHAKQFFLLPPRAESPQTISFQTDPSDLV